MPSGTVERFRPTSGQLLGWTGLVLAAVAVVGGLVEGPSWSVVSGALAFAVLDWAALLKPRLIVSGRWLVLRNMLETIHLPLAAVEELAVRQVFAVRVGEKRYVSPAVGRSFRQTLKSNRRGASADTAAAKTGTDLADQAYADFVEQRIRHLAAEARELESVGRYSAAQDALAGEVRRVPAWLEIGLLVVTVAAFVVSLVV
ncbi:hypothetical protein [Nocardioides sp. W7]|uniref:hypothetical protein n=1 Tax=Nocardioides sp. W7 TaxID=2931390 RepID=UPI001FD4FF5D|nr:hypothetical protein [Nocardioides sp. W7]